LQYADILVINDSEVRQLAKNPNIVQAARIIQKNLGQKRPNKATLIIKQGEYGCLMLNQNQWFSLPAFPLENVYDPTGAGDAFAGGLIGYLASQKKINEKNLKQALIFGTVMASFAVEKLGPYNLTNLSQTQIKNRASALRGITKI
jgi:sugar/nucleoside kinase (ribokinase family)